MANIRDDGSCIFHWEIIEPFFPFRRLDASFFRGYRNATTWKLSLCPRRRHFNLCEFSFNLQCIQPSNENRTVVAKRMEVVITFNGVRKEWVQENYRFHIGNRHMYVLDTEVEIDTYTTERDMLIFQVAMDLPNRKQGGNPIYYPYSNLKRLSKDLLRLRESGDYSDLNLIGNNSLRTFPAHSYILRMRWCNFFEEHKFRPEDGDADGPIQIGISYHVLQEILNFLYSCRGMYWGGHLFGGIEQWSEVFEVIDRYKLHHIYTAIFKNDSVQDRETCNAVIIRNTLYRLDRENGESLDSLIPPWNVNPGTYAEFIFTIRFFMDEGEPKFSYTLLSRAQCRILVQVNLQFMRWGTDIDTHLPVHHREYMTVPGQMVESGNCSFESRHAHIYDCFLGRDRLEDSSRVVNMIFCLLKFSRLIAAHVSFEVPREDDDDEIYYKDSEYLYEVLSRHMYDLAHDSESCDLTVSCPTDIPEAPPEKFQLHKAIFTARIPKWRSVIEEVPESDAIPDHVTCILKSVPFSKIIDWIYSGKLYPIPTRYHRDVEHFAVRGNLLSLRHLLHRMG